MFILSSFSLADVILILSRQWQLTHSTSNVIRLSIVTIDCHSRSKRKFTKFSLSLYSFKFLLINVNKSQSTIIALSPLSDSSTSSWRLHNFSNFGFKWKKEFQIWICENHFFFLRLLPSAIPHYERFQPGEMFMNAFWIKNVGVRDF